MNAKDQITTAVDGLQACVRKLVELPCKVTINTQEYRVFFDAAKEFAGRYNLVDSREWADVDRWLIKQPNEHLTLEEAGYLKLALEKLRFKALEVAGERLTEDETKKANKQVEEFFLEIIKHGSEQIQLLNEQNDILKASGKTAKRWYWIMFAIALAGVVAAFVQAFK